jgi:hypothetical protein
MNYPFSTHCPKTSTRDRRQLLLLVAVGLALGSIAAASTILPRKASVVHGKSADAQLLQGVRIAPSQSLLQLSWSVQS